MKNSHQPIQKLAQGTIRELLETRARETPDAVFLIAPESGIEITFLQLHCAVQSLCLQLQALGSKPGDHVSMMMENGPGTACLFLAAMAGGYVVSPLNPLAGAAQLQYVVNHCESTLVFVSQEHEAQLRVAINALDRHIDVVELNPHVVPAFNDTKPEIDRLPAPKDDALLMYTSGTTGNPKGVLLTQRAVLAGGMNTVTAHELAITDRALCVLPLYHINAQIVTIIAPLLSGGSVVLPKRFSAGNFWLWLCDNGCTWFSVVPTIISYLLKSSEALSKPQLQALAKVRFGRSASAALPPALCEAFESRFGISIVETMGLTETAAQILSNPLPADEHKFGSPGIAYGNEVAVFNAQDQKADPREVGEIVVRGDNVMREYFNNPTATESTFKNGWLYTGDLGYRDEEGYFFITGRLKELIIKGGENIAPREIDDVLYRHEAVLEAAAFALPCDNYGEQVAACVALKPGFECAEADLARLCEDQLGRYKTPSRFYFLDELPKGPSGKIQRLRLAELVAEKSE